MEYNIITAAKVHYCHFLLIRGFGHMSAGAEELLNYGYAQRNEIGGKGIRFCKIWGCLKLLTE